jgi:ribosomal protein S18 acetylase RimI-like enzyme
LLAVLRPEYHRQGIASAAIGVVLKDWAVAQMGCTEIRAQCFLSNVGSVKLWEKYGFVDDPALRRAYFSLLCSFRCHVLQSSSFHISHRAPHPRFHSRVTFFFDSTKLTYRSEEITVTEAKGGGVEQGCALVWYLK